MFSSQNIVFVYLKVVKKKHLYLLSQCFGNSYYWIQIKPSDYCDGVYAQLKYLNSYDHYIWLHA